MGYRSDVAYMITGSREDILSLVAELRLGSPETQIVIEEVTIGELSDETLYIAAHFESVKWYEGYKDVNAHECMWDKAKTYHENHGRKFSGIFKRIGEDTEDIDQREFGDDPRYDYIEISRMLCCSIPLGEKSDIRHKKEAHDPIPE